ncbi:hypothetical protein PAECIP111802_07190 [Paenibacillus allorhizosphaerae]|uniref:Uncharacterized protein n=1 Tax=Paenibacillus allorhizosphaerae TaxID=2849866 RepID=A0ABM8VUK8_9BACL|nr:hypothetical protein PAECIP111802_07190 [Paenibacillus allorhizosphaerae]
MNKYESLIGVVIEKLDQTYRDLSMVRNGLASALEGQSDESIRDTPELIQQIAKSGAAIKAAPYSFRTFNLARCSLGAMPLNCLNCLLK